MSRKTFFILWLILFIIPHTIHAEEYSLNDLFRLVLERSETIKIAEKDVYISKREKDKAKAALLPTLSAFGKYTRYSKEKSRDTFLLQPEYTNEWGFRLDQSMSLSGREFTAFNIAKEEIRKSRFDLEAVKEETLLEVASSFYEVFKSKKALEIAMANVERLTKHRDATITKLKVGEVTKTVLLRAEAELADAQSELIKAENALKLAKSILAKKVGISGDYELKEPPSTLSPETQEQEILIKSLIGDCQMSTLECLKKVALSERAEIKTLSVQKKIAKDEIKYAKGAYWPDLSIEGVYFRQENEPSSTFGLREKVYGALTLNFPFFEGGLKKAEVSEARARLKQAEYSLLDTKNAIKIEVERSYLDLLTESAVLSKLKAKVKYALDNYKAVSKQFQYGLADSLDVIDANTLLLTAERELANAEYDYQLALLKLRRATGTFLKAVINGLYNES
jgi:outer membrane protein